MIDWLIVVAFVIYSIWIGFSARKQSSKNLSEYFLAGRTIRGWRAGLSMAATQFAADTPLLVMGLLAVGGAFSLWRLWIYGLAFLLMGFVLSAAWRRAGVLTDAELTMVRYSAKGALALRALKGIYYGTVINCVVIAFVLVAAVRVFEVFLPWHLWLGESIYGPLSSLIAATGISLSSGASGIGELFSTTNNMISIFLMLIFVALYSTTGGLRSVISTDVMQLILMMGGTAAYAWVAVNAGGGLFALPEQLVATYGAANAERFLSFSPTLDDAWVPFLVVMSLQWFYQMNSDGTGYLAQRTMACADDQQARIAAVTFTMTQIVVRSLLWLLIGVSLLVIFPFDANQPMTDAVIGQRELTFVRGIDELLPVGIRGLMLTAMLAALASTLSTHLNWGASYWSNDLYAAVWVKRIRHRTATQRELVRVAKISNVVIIAIALVIMANLGSIQNAWLVSLLFGAGTGAVLVLRWLWERINLYCEAASILVSLIAAPLLLLFVEDEWMRLAAMAVISTVAVIFAALCMPPTDTGRLVAFYNKAHPPGWWRNTAKAAGDDSDAPIKRLRAALIPMLACAVSVYSWLIGFAKLLLQEDGRLIAGFLVIVGCLAMPLWVRVLRKTET